jgi:branched-chain amino acid transport system substrate-binding protein
MFPTKTQNGVMNANGADLARREIAQATRAFAGSNASVHVRRVALVVCNDADDAMRAAKHLVDDVGVPAVLGFGTGQTLLDVAGSLLIRRGVVSVATLTPSPLVTRLPQPEGLPRMVWRTTYNLDGVAEAAAHMIPEVLEARLPASARPTHVVLLRQEVLATQSFANTFYKELVFNGKSAVRNGADYLEVPLSTESSSADIARAVSRVVDATPSFVVVLGPESSMLPVVEGVEARLPRAGPGTRRPIYVVANDSTESYVRTISAGADAKRLYSIDSASGSTVNARFVMRYNETYHDPVSLVLNPGSTYDAVYALAYAAFALEPEQVTGPALAHAFARLVPPGRRVEVGAPEVFDALTTLSAGGKIDLQGATSDLDFDLATGEAPADFALLCPSIGADGGVVDVESDVLFRARGRRVEGTLRCP